MRPSSNAQPQPVEPLARQFTRQWALLRQSDPFRAGWNIRELGADYVLYTDHDLDVVDLSRFGESHDRVIVLGIAILAAQPERDIDSAIRSRLDASGWKVDEVVIGISGTYVVLHCREETIDFYTDPAGMRGVYYREDRAASTPLLLPEAWRDTGLDALFPFGEPDEWYPGDLCPYRGMKALMANHRLSLPGGAVSRFWPSESFPDQGDIEPLDVIASTMEGMVDAASRRWRIIGSLTGGKDSRVSLAASRAFVDRLEYFTLRSPRTRSCDAEYPAALASRFGLRHRFVDVEDPDDDLLRLYDAQTAGMATGERRRVVTAAARLGGRNVVHLNGNLGAIAKGFYWHNRHPRNMRRRSLLREFRHRPPAVRNAIDRWFDSLPDVNPATAYNLMYLEQRGGKWMGIGETGSQLFYDSLSLFNNRQVFQSLLQLSRSELSTGSALVRLVDRMWPALLSVPYCRATRGWSKLIPLSYRVFIKSVLTTPRSTSRKGRRRA